MLTWIQMLKGKPSLDTDPMLVKFHLNIMKIWKLWVAWIASRKTSKESKKNEFSEIVKFC